MTIENRFNNGKIGFAFTDNDLGTRHAILITPNVTTSHYVYEAAVTLSAVSIDSELLHIEQTDTGTVLHFSCKEGGEFTVTLGNVRPEQLCDAVESVRLQQVTE